MHRIFDFIGNPSHSRTISILALLIIALAIPLTVNIAQKQQELRQHAGGGSCPQGGTAAFDPKINAIGCYNDPTNLQGYNGPAVGATVPTNTPPPPTPVASSSAAPAACIPTVATTCDINCTLPSNCGKATTCNNNCTLINGSRTPGQCQPCISSSPSPTCDASKGFVSACTTADQGKTVQNGPCNRVCPAGTAKAGQTVPGVSYKQCQGICWYDSLYDQTPAKIAEGQNPSNGPGWCYGVPGVPDPCTAIPTGVSLSCGNPTCSNGVSPIHPASSGNWYCPLPNNAAVDSGIAPICPSSSPTLATVSFTVGLDGIGTTPDRKSTPNSSASNKNPFHRQRPLKTYTTDNTGKVTFGNGSLNYDDASGKFLGTATFAVPAGNYSVTVQTDGFMADATRADLTPGSTVSVAFDHLINGDMDHDGRVTILDYNFLPGCIFKPASGACASADLDDNGVIDQFDYNLFLREYKYVQDRGL